MRIVRTNGSPNYCIIMIILLPSWEWLVCSRSKLCCPPVKTRRFWGMMFMQENKSSSIKLIVNV
ncbi:hypothetical protein GLYMA_08G007601v4 [Glycine max]|nr:hypothetical protein GLYMA_08G007601v4 [Glycine max]KAH1048961.1 hypothetical protein GYH30_019848 [Glycine max]